MSLWMTGANETDVKIVAKKSISMQRLFDGLDIIARQDGPDLVLDPHRSVRMAEALLAGYDIRDWERVA